MQNGNAVIALIEEATAVTSSTNIADYYVAPLPTDMDERLRQIVTQFTALTPEQRAVLVLHDLHGLTDSEVAGALNLQIPAVKSRLVRARA
ncbi:MAG TPA: hypothetical protein EYP41_17390, partial [Anaerolineae bacterium]|nr:hypothetical protein [Anaerolineae bacterium]